MFSDWTPIHLLSFRFRVHFHDRFSFLIRILDWLNSSSPFWIFVYVIFANSLLDFFFGCTVFSSGCDLVLATFEYWSQAVCWKSSMENILMLCSYCCAANTAVCSASALHWFWFEMLLLNCYMMLLISAHIFMLRSFTVMISTIPHGTLIWWLKILLRYVIIARGIDMLCGSWANCNINIAFVQVWIQ